MQSKTRKSEAGKTTTKKILIAKVASMGDILQATSIVPAIKDKYPSAEIHWLLMPQFKALLEGNPCISKALSFPTQSGLSRLYQALKLRREIKEQGYDIVINLHRAWLFHFFFFLTGIPIRSGVVTRSPSIFSTHSTPYDLKKHRVHRFIGTLKPLGITQRKALSLCKAPVFHTQKQNRRKTQSPITKNTIVIAPFGGRNQHSEMPSRRWGNYHELLTELHQLYPKQRFALVGGKEEFKDINKLIKKADCQNSARVMNLAGKLSINELAILLSQAKLFIGNDSFPLFMAASQEIPIIGIYGPTDATVIHPSYKEAHFIAAKPKTVPCSPCYNPLHGTKGLAYNCPHDIACMKSITVEQVKRSADKILAQRKK